MLLVEILLLLAVGLLSQPLNILANALVSFACAMQVQAFRKVDGYAFASTMCIGNLRSGVESLMAGGRTRDRKLLGKAGHYFSVILLFALGAGIGGLLIPRFGDKTIWFSCLILTLGFLVMFIRGDLEENPDIQAAENSIHQELRQISQDLHKELNQEHDAIEQQLHHPHKK